MATARHPSIQIRKLEGEFLEFLLTNTDTSMANALRRIIIAEVPTVAIDLVEFTNNTTVLNDEFLAHRLGLIPLWSEHARHMKRPFEPYDRDDEVQVVFELDIKCTSDSTMQVTDKDLMPSGQTFGIEPVRCTPAAARMMMPRHAHAHAMPAVCRRQYLPWERICTDRCSSRLCLATWRLHCPWGGGMKAPSCRRPHA